MTTPLGMAESRLGATVLGWGTRFRVWAPLAQSVEVVLEKADGVFEHHAMRKSTDGYFAGVVADSGVGDWYSYLVDGKGPFPDPASRFQPHGVHGASQIVDPASFVWTDADWKGVAADDLIFYELHIGTFTPAATFAGAEAKLPELRELGITVVELMPVADFAGARNWGYDGVALFAPSHRYGAPDDLRRFVNAAHRLGLAVFLDVVYNHLGPDGAYHGTFSPYYASATHRNPWGDSLNFDGPMSGPVRDYFIENAVQWIREYRLDGLRLDATHAIADDSPRQILASMSSAVQASVAETGRRVHLIAEDVRNLDYIVKSESQGGWGLDGAWSDDFHHQMRRAMAGDNDGYFQDFDGSTASIAQTARAGWYYSGQHAPYFHGSRGSDPSGLPYGRFVFFIQNHDQIGNRAFGDRLHHVIDAAAYRAASALMLLLPESPLLFMGQEWAASTPFLYFTDHNPELGKLVTEGRRREFSRFAKFSSPESNASIPDPQEVSTFESCRLIWEERGRQPHSCILRLYQRLMYLRRSEPSLRSQGCSGELEIEALDESVLVLRRTASTGETTLAVFRLAGDGAVDLREHRLALLSPNMAWEVRLQTEDPSFAANAVPLVVDTAVPAMDFKRPGAVIFHAVKRGRA